GRPRSSPPTTSGPGYTHPLNTDLNTGEHPNEGLASRPQQRPAPHRDATVWIGVNAMSTVRLSSAGGDRKGSVSDDFGCGCCGAGGDRGDVAGLARETECFHNE